MFLQKYQLPTGRHSFHDITATVRRAISESGCLLYTSRCV